jgi:hypothetical protein
MGDLIDFLDETGAPVRETRVLSVQGGVANDALFVGADGTVSGATMASLGGVTVRKFPFTFATAGLATGYALYTPAVGDLIYDIGISVDTLFNGTTPLADVGTFSGGNVGLFGELGAAIDLGTADADVTDNAGLAEGGTATWLSAAIIVKNTAAESGVLPWTLKVTAANPLLLVVSQNGQKGGTATGATAGAGVVYVVTATPV